MHKRTRDAHSRHAEFAAPETIAPLQSWLSRRAALRQLSVGALATLAATAQAGPAASRTRASAPPAGTGRDIDILNFALNAEYLEAEFYTYATTGQGIDSLGIAITGQNGVGQTATPGATTGGAKINFDTTTLAAVAANLADDERKHVSFIRSVIIQLGGTPIAKPAINLAALSTLGVDPTTSTGFVIGGRSFCDVGVSAYAGTSVYLTNKTAIAGAGRVLAVEAFHAGNLRLQIAQRGITSPALDTLDVPPPPATSSYFTVDNNALAVIRTIQQVLNVVYLATAANPSPTSGGFFPNGANYNPGLLQLITPMG